MSSASMGLRGPDLDPKPTDEMKRGFLDALVASDKVEVTDWEAGFIESTLGKEVFTDQQRIVITSMMDRYQHRM